MLSCKEIVKMLSSSEELTFTKKAELKFHLFMCKHCSNYEKQMGILTERFSQIVQKRADCSRGEIEKLEIEVLEKLKEATKDK